MYIHNTRKHKHVQTNVNKLSTVNETSNDKKPSQVVHQTVSC